MVVPSDAVQLIDALFPQFVDHPENSARDFKLHWGSTGEIAGVVNVVHRIPSELILLTGREFVLFTFSLSALENLVSAARTDRGAELRADPRVDPLHPIVILRRELAKCPDEPLSTTISGLRFIPDADQRESLSQDIHEAERALANGEWKAATVLGGSVIEALLLWALEQEGETVVGNACLANPVANPSRFGGAPQFPPYLPLLAYQDLGWFLKIAQRAGVVTAQTVAIADQARKFRNLIHPGRVQREGRCDCPTARATLAAVGFVLKDLEARYPAVW